jgi:hypothetical protein
VTAKNGRFVPISHVTPLAYPKRHSDALAQVHAIGHPKHKQTVTASQVAQGSVKPFFTDNELDVKRHSFNVGMLGSLQQVRVLIGDTMKDFFNLIRVHWDVHRCADRVQSNNSMGQRRGEQRDE